MPCGDTPCQSPGTRRAGPRPAPESSTRRPPWLRMLPHDPPRQPVPSSRTPPGTEAVTQEPHGTADGLQRGFLRHPQPPANSRQKSSKACLKRHGAGAQQQSPGAPNPSSAQKEPEEADQRATQPRNTAQGLRSACCPIAELQNMWIRWGKSRHELWKQSLQKSFLPQRGLDGDLSCSCAPGLFTPAAPSLLGDASLSRGKFWEKQLVWHSKVGKTHHAMQL